MTAWNEFPVRRIPRTHTPGGHEVAPGCRWDWVVTAPGIPMLFMGQEFMEDKQWSDDVIDHPELLIYWDGLAAPDPTMRDFLRFTRELIALRWQLPALRAEGFRIVHAHDNNRVLAFHRWVPGEGYDVVVVLSLANVNQYGYRVGFPADGSWREAFNSDVYDNWGKPASHRQRRRRVCRFNADAWVRLFGSADATGKWLAGVRPLRYYAACPRVIAQSNPPTHPTPTQAGAGHIVQTDTGVPSRIDCAARIPLRMAGPIPSAISRVASPAASPAMNALSRRTTSTRPAGNNYSPWAHSGLPEQASGSACRQTGSSDA